VSTFTNLTADTVVLHPCRPGGSVAVVLEKWVAGEWRSALGQACADMRIWDAPRLAPGESRTDTVSLFGSLRPNEEPRFELDSVPGYYRAVYWKAHGPWRADKSLGELLPKSRRLSNPFRLVE
jgi:hypothetical protein